MWFSSDFRILAVNNECRDWVEVKFLDNLGRNGYRFCGNHAPKYPIISIRNAAVIVFRATSLTDDYNQRRGFRILYSAEYHPNMPDDESISAPKTSTPFHWQCSFENVYGKYTLCGMTQSTDDQFDWSQGEGPTPSKDTGPQEAMSKPYYVFIEVSNRNRHDMAL